MNTHFAKTRVLYFIVTVVICFFLYGSSRGPATNYDYDCTGAETSSPRIGCTCHGTSATSNIILSIELDSAGTPTTHYLGGASYTIKLTGINNTSDTLPRFGFQLCSILGTVAGASPVNAGTWQQPYPPNTQFKPVSGTRKLGLMEHSGPLLPSSGSGGNGTIFSVSFNWTAPSSGTGSISLWAALLAVNNNGYSDFFDSWNMKHIVIKEWPISSGITENINELHFKIFLDPSCDKAKIEFLLEKKSEVSAELYDLTGKKIATLFSYHAMDGPQQETADLASLNLKSGLYIASLNAGTAHASKVFFIAN